MIATGSNDFKLLEGFYFCSCLYPNCKNQIVSTHNATANHSGWLQWRLKHSSQFFNDSSYSYTCLWGDWSQLLFRAAKY